MRYALAACANDLKLLDWIAASSALIVKRPIENEGPIAIQASRQRTSVVDELANFSTSAQTEQRVFKKGVHMNSNSWVRFFAESASRHPPRE
jgi:hypothetical protein